MWPSSLVRFEAASLAIPIACALCKAGYSAEKSAMSSQSPCFQREQKRQFVLAITSYFGFIG